ncbi:DEAD/DEAH box helicase family protein [Marispirochaeta aestuarii]|uniref:DEAD/DEAH box helicase n=1 Tax=Marispirochaeta aestuarii TaxID=1963862 RepID=UPI002ABD20DB|nr:DEAD/DEAH box helicase family protein [Marispirochaeta aestuarii]
MKLRKHQAAMVNVCQEILEGKPITQIILAVTPGGGKSAHPVIIAENLIPAIAEKLLWVVPRNSLKYQGEEEFCDPRWKTNHRLRAMDGNRANPSRGYSGYITTYQAIGSDPAVHVKEFEEHRYILFLDEPHHIAESGAWEDALRPLVKRAILIIYASGTLSRGDGKRIAFLDYKGLHVDLSDREHVRIIRYSRKDALSEKAICPVHFRTLDGSAEWKNEDGTTGEAQSLASAGDDSAKAVFTALRTEYAYELLEQCAMDWAYYRLETYPDAKLLVVAPTIELAREYNAYLSQSLPRHLGAIATSEDTPKARKCIEAFRRGVFSYLVTVSMAYEGLSIREITHIACLTHIRSVPWLEQCFARGNRLAPGKHEAWIYGPKDRNFLDAIRMIENEQLVPLSDESQGKCAGAEGREESSGEGRPWITPLRSAAIGAEKPKEAPVYSHTAPPSEQEKVLRQQIRDLKQLELQKRRSGSLRSARRVMDMTIRSIVDKSLDEMNIEELNAVWLEMRRRYA